MNHSCSRFTDSRCSLRYLHSRTQQTTSSSSKTSQTTQEDVSDGWKRTGAESVSLFFRVRECHKTKRAEPFKEKMNWGTETETEIILRTEDFTPTSTRCWSNQPCLFNDDKTQNTSRTNSWWIIFLCLREYLSDGHEHLQTVTWSKQREHREENLSCSATHTHRNIGLIRQHSRLEKLTSWDSRGDLWKRLFGNVLIGFESTMCNILICVVTTGRRGLWTWNESGLLLQRWSGGRSGCFALQQQEAGMMRSEQEKDKVNLFS